MLHFWPEREHLRIPYKKPPISVYEIYDLHAHCQIECPVSSAKCENSLRIDCQCPIFIPTWTHLCEILKILILMRSPCLYLGMSWVDKFEILSIISIRLFRTVFLEKIANQYTHIQHFSKWIFNDTKSEVMTNATIDPINE